MVVKHVMSSYCTQGFKLPCFLTVKEHIIYDNMAVYLGYIFIFIVSYYYFETSAEVSVTISYESAYSDGPIYYILNGENFTMVCEYGLHETDVRNVVWYDMTESAVIPLFAKFVIPGGEVQGTPWEDRVTWTYTDTSHRVTVLTADILTDGIRYRCDVTNKDLDVGEAYQDLTSKIYSPPEVVGLSGPTTVIEHTDSGFLCQVSSVYPGKLVTDFRLRVGSEYYTGGTETESLESNGVTYTVIYTYTGTFSRSQQGQQVQCEVTWQNNTVVKTVKTSSTKQLEVYYISVYRPTVSPSPVISGEVLTITCSVESNPTPRLRLYRIGVDSSLKDVVAKSLEWEYIFQKEESGAEFYCRADDNNMVPGWGFDEQSEKFTVEVFSVPEPPHSVVFESVTAISVTLSWVAGDNGGTEQTFTVYYRQEGETKILFDEGILSDPDAARMTHKIIPLIPQTTYYLRIQAKNTFGESDQQPELSLTTIGVPVIDGPLQANIYDEIVAFYWGPIAGSFSYATITICIGPEYSCTSLYNITSPGISFHAIQTVHTGGDYFLLIYQEQDEVNRATFNESIKYGNEHSSPSQAPQVDATTSQTGYIVGLAVTVTLVVILAIVIVVLVCRNKICVKKVLRESQGNLSSNTISQVTDKAAYENVSKAMEYEMTNAAITSQAAEYTDLKHPTYEAIS